jgi:hypothetical protein
MQASRRMALLAATILGLAPVAAPAADGGPGDAGPDGGGDTDTDTDTEPCDGACAEEFYNACACGPDDPCGWAGDGVCDEACVELDYVDEMFDDSSDCDPVPDGGTDTDADTDTDTDADTDTSDAGIDGSTSELSAAACTCAVVGVGEPPTLIGLLAIMF